MIDFLATPIDTDLAYRWVKAVFPSDPNQPYGQAFAVFTSALTFIGALFMGWHIMIGIVTSAYSGKVLGERYHQIWAPLRVVLGFGLLIPIAGGFSTVHYLLRDVVGVAAVQLANLPIVTYINGMAEKSPSINPVGIQGRSLAETVLGLQTCAAVVQGFNTVVDPYVLGAEATLQPEARPTTFIPGSGVATSPAVIWDYEDCGSLTFVQPSLEGEYFDELNSDGTMKAFTKARQEATQQLIADISAGTINHVELGKYFAKKDFDEEMTNEHAREMIRSGIIYPNLAANMEAAADKWNKAMAAAAQDVFTAASSDGNKAKLIERINKYGFMAAGSYERSLSQISGVVIGLANDTPTATLSSPGYRYDDAYRGAMAAVQAARRTDSHKVALNEQGTATDGVAPFDEMLGYVAPSMHNMKLNSESSDPVGDMISMGHRLVGGAQAAIIAMALANGVAEGAGNSAAAWVGIGGAVLGVVQYLTQWFGYIVLISLIIGIMHAFVLPMIPMIMVFVMGVSWLVLFLEAAIAGVLWAFAFIRMDGQEFFDRNQAPGVTLLFNLILRPAIGMLAFIGGLILVPVLLNSLAIIWDDAFYVQSGKTTWNGVIQWLIGLIMFTWMQWHLYLRIWGLVPTIADRVGHWMGMQMHGYNDGQETQAAVGAMVAAGGAIGKAPVMPGAKAGKSVGSGIVNSGPAPGAPSKGEVRKIAGDHADPGRSRRTN